MWIRVDDTLPSHLKIKRMAKELKISQAAAIGHIVSLWLWTASNVPDGDLSVIDVEDIAEVAGWGRKAKGFVDCLISVGFLNEDYSIHDWFDYAGKMLEDQEKQREKNRERQARYRERARQRKENGNGFGGCDITPGNGADSRDITCRVTCDITENNGLRNGNGNGNITPIYDTGRNDTLLSLSSSSLSDGERAVFEFGILPMVRALDGVEPDECQRAELLTFYREMGASVVSKAVDVTRKAGKGAAYLLGVLRKKREQGVSCLEEWDAVEAAGVYREAQPVPAAFTGLED